MSLEDHVGDIIRKARAMSRVSADTAAKSAGLAGAELDALEESGRYSAPPDFLKLAGLLGLDGQKLEKIAEGWLPSEKDLTRWRELRCITTTQGGMAVNCYLVWMKCPGKRRCSTRAGRPNPSWILLRRISSN